MAMVERHVGAPAHSALQKVLVVHLAAFEKALGIAVRPACNAEMEATGCRVPDVLVMERPFRQTEETILDPPCLVVEVLSPEDRMSDTLRRLREYENAGVRHIVQMDPDERITYVFERGGLRRRELRELQTARGMLPFDTRALLAELDEEGGAFAG